MRGSYIVIEGIDGSGKSTLAANLEKILNEKEVPIVRVWEPYSEEIKEIIEQVKQDEPREEEIILANLFATDRLLLQDIITDYLTAGINVISDRSKLSSFAYQTADPMYNQTINSKMIDPDVIFYLDSDPEEAAKRYEGSDKFENVDFLKKVRVWYKRYLPVISEEGQIPFARLNVDPFTEEQVAEYFTGALRELNIIGE